MSRLDKFEEILNSYDGRKYEEVPGYKKNFCLVFEGHFLSTAMMRITPANIKEIALDIPRDKSYACIHTEPARGVILTHWIDDLDSLIKMNKMGMRLNQVPIGNTSFALKQLASDRAFSGMIVTDEFIDPIRRDGLHDALSDLSERGNKFCVIYFHNRGDLPPPKIDLIDPVMFSAIDSFADRYHVTCLKDLYELTNAYITYAIHGKSKPTKFKEVRP